MKSHVDFGEREIKSVKGAIRCFRDALEKNPKIVPVGRPWNENERTLRIEHLDYIYNLFGEMQSGKNSVTIDQVTICFDLSENDILATFAACQYAQHALKNIDEIKNKVENSEQVLNDIGKLVNNFQIIGLEKLTMMFEYE